MITQIKTFTIEYKGQTIIAICSWSNEGSNNKPDVWIRYIIALSQLVVEDEFYNSSTCNQLFKRIQKWALKNNLNLWSY